MDIQTEKGLREALSYLESGKPDEAKKVLDTILMYNLESKELILSGKYCLFWSDALLRLSDIEDSYERGERLLAEWKNFLDFIRQQQETYENAVYAACRGVFRLALYNYTRLLDERIPAQKAEILRKCGICYKKLGEFDNAKMCLSEANSLTAGQAAVIAELADCYALCGDDKAAKVLFREAFFLDFKKIDLVFLDSELIRCLIEKTAEKGYSGELLNAWIPVYGVLWGVFNMKRNMKSQEIGRLKQEIYALENEQKDPSRSTEILTPRLINMYFWLIDYCQAQNDSKLINETLLKIKILDTTVYNLYVK
ncbi:hypothetical protein [uncultured Treponema sp.]|uniref:tetratricopeptide repeat protein n=1 Tax=uncultured Treponema sp. TaxID=162155 RepID=UPI0025983510|nr:hypothetical protein [uncultured Treponema sp.]